MSICPITQFEIPAPQLLIPLPANQNRQEALANRNEERLLCQIYNPDISEL